ncbi:hypothetical protein Bca101_097104 [Brassica carinata]
MYSRLKKMLSTQNRVSENSKPLLGTWKTFDLDTYQKVRERERERDVAWRWQEEEEETTEEEAEWCRR